MDSGGCRNRLVLLCHKRREPLIPHAFFLVCKDEKTSEIKDQPRLMSRGRERPPPVTWGGETERPLHWIAKPPRLSSRLGNSEPEYFHFDQPAQRSRLRGTQGDTPV
jgi:hypothetical protein